MTEYVTKEELAEILTIIAEALDGSYEGDKNINGASLVDIIKHVIEVRLER